MGRSLPPEGTQHAGAGLGLLDQEGVDGRLQVLSRNLAATSVTAGLQGPGRTAGSSQRRRPAPRPPGPIRCTHARWQVEPRQSPRRRSTRCARREGSGQARRNRWRSQIVAAGGRSRLGNRTGAESGASGMLSAPTARRAGAVGRRSTMISSHYGWPCVGLQAGAAAIDLGLWPMSFTPSCSAWRSRLWMSARDSMVAMRGLDPVVAMANPVLAAGRRPRCPARPAWPGRCCGWMRCPPWRSSRRGRCRPGGQHRRPTRRRRMVPRGRHGTSVTMALARWEDLDLVASLDLAVGDAAPEGARLVARAFAFCGSRIGTGQGWRPRRSCGGQLLQHLQQRGALVPGPLGHPGR